MRMWSLVCSYYSDNFWYLQEWRRICWWNQRWILTRWTLNPSDSQQNLVLWVSCLPLANPQRTWNLPTSREARIPERIFLLFQTCFNILGCLTFSSTANFLRFQENSKTAMMIETNIPPKRTMKTPPRFANPSWELLALASTWTKCIRCNYMLHFILPCKNRHLFLFPTIWFSILSKSQIPEVPELQLIWLPCMENLTRWKSWNIIKYFSK